MWSRVWNDVLPLTHPIMEWCVVLLASVILLDTALLRADEILIQDQENRTIAGCKPPERTDNNDIYLGEYPIGYNYTVRCVNSTVIGKPVITCLEDGMWRPSESYCKETSCPRPETPENGYLTSYTDNFLLLSYTINYACKHQFQLVSGDKSRQCIPGNSSLSGLLPRCARVCGAVYVPLNGSVHTDCLYENCTAIFMCHDGYRVTGDQMATCEHNGSWSHRTRPKCTKIYCETPPVIENTEINILDKNLSTSETLFPYGFRVTYSCLYNFTLFGNHTLRCGRGGTWQGQTPYCVVTSAIPVTTPVSTPVTTLQHSTATTLATTIPASTIEGLKCEKPRPIVHGRFYFHGEITVLYKCDYGYTLIGIHERTCLDNRTWSHDAPTCVPRFQDFAGTWRSVFQKQREWSGTYVYWERPVPFRLWVLENKQAGADHLEVLFDDEEAKLYIRVSYLSGVLRFTKTRLFTKSERFLPGHDWAFEGYLRKHNNDWQFVANTFHSDPGFEKLQMSPRIVYEPPPPISEPDVNAVALTLGIIIAMVSIMFAAALAAFYVRRKTLKATGHRSVTSFENPVYDYQNSLKDQEQYQEPSEC